MESHSCILGHPVKAETVCYVLVSVVKFGNRVLMVQQNVGFATAALTNKSTSSISIPLANRV